MKQSAWWLVAALLWCGSAGAQFKTNLERYIGDNAAGYLQPLVTALGIDFNRGWYHSARIPRSDFYIYLGANAMMTFIADDDRVYQATTEGAFSPAQTMAAPTIVGDGKAVRATGTGGTTYIFPGGFDIESVLFATPQITIGSVAGTEVTFRYIALEIGDSEIGNINLFGAGVRHSISQYFDNFPIELAAGLFYQKFKLDEDFIDATAWHYGAQVSKSFSLLTLYGGLGFDAANIKVEYEPEATPGERIALDIDAENGLRVTAGVNLKLAIFNLNADYSFGAQNAVGLGFGFVF